MCYGIGDAELVFIERAENKTAARETLQTKNVQVEVSFFAADADVRCHRKYLAHFHVVQSINVHRELFFPSGMYMYLSQNYVSWAT